ncbi:hypothetical protein, partial [Lysinibacillus sp. UBA5994]
MNVIKNGEEATSIELMCVSSIPMKLNFMRFRDEECKKKNEDEYRNQAIKSLMNEHCSEPQK